MPAHPDTIPLPRSWTRRVRSAVLHAISLAQHALAFTRSWAANSVNERIRLMAECARLNQEVSLLREEVRIKDGRIMIVPAQRRPHYPPWERMAILELRAARGWTLKQTAETFHLTPATIASWMGRLDEEGVDALVRVREPVNRFPDFVRYIVRRLRTLCPAMGKVRIAQVLCRAGLHLGSTTVGRMLREPWRPASAGAEKPGPTVTASRPNHVWHVDLSAIPTQPGLWAPWMPFALPQRWPFCWWVVVAIDHFSRRVMGVGVFENPPSSKAIRAFLGQAMARAGERPRHIITDQDRRLTAKGFRRWCRRRGMRQRFGALGKYGSIAVVERFMRTLKSECARRIIVPYRRDRMRREVNLFVAWYNEARPHTRLEGATPHEVYHGLQPATMAPRHEPRARWPRGSPCAGPQAKVRGRRGVTLEVEVDFLAKRRHLPVVRISRAA